MNATPANKLPLSDKLGAILFWFWNILFLAFVLLGFAPVLLPELVLSLRAGITPLVYFIYAVVIVLIPVVCVVLALTVFRNDPGKLFALGYVVEGPSMLLLVLLLFVVRETTLTIAMLALITALGMIAFLWQLIRRAQTPTWTAVQAAGLTLMLVVALYAAGWVAFYALPLASVIWEAITGFFSSLSYLFGNLRYEWRFIPMSILGMLVLIVTGTLVVLMPVTVPILTVRAWLNRARALVGQIRISKAALMMLLPLVVWGVIFGFSLRQPQGKAFALLSTPPATPAQAQSLIDQQETIRAGLLNAYLSSYRYLSAVGEVSHIRDIYMFTPLLNLEQEKARSVQRAYEAYIRPLLYIPAHPAAPGEIRDSFAFTTEPGEAAQLYEDFFDQPITDGERTAVVRAVRSTWSADQAQAAWRAVDDREVRLNHQEVTVSEYGDWAEIEIYEVYQNITSERQEVIYYFSLPESAAVTGVWLGNSPDRSLRFAYRVAPRGAAQASYRSELIRNVDPALIEQIGPRQYRLRVFPIDPMNISTVYDGAKTTRTVHEGPELHLWLTYRTPAIDGAWPLPQLADKFNVFWDRASERSVAGKTVRGNEPDWLPASIPASGMVLFSEHQIYFANGTTVIAHPADPSSLPQPSTDLRLAVVLDRSRSMASQAGQVSDALARLNELSSAGADLDVYLTSSPYRGEEPSRTKLAALDFEQIQYYGGQNAAELLIQYQKLSAGEAYDAVLVLTDGTGYELGEIGQTPHSFSQPVWIIHLGGFPLGYDDPTIDAVQASGGGVAGSVDEALTRLAVRLNSAELGGPGSIVDLVDGYLWITSPGQSTDAYATDGFAALAARRVILAEAQRQRGELTNLETLDALHQIAVENSVVTPYSSMIVLVTPQQQSRLDNLEKGADRFNRELEELGDTLGADPNAPPPISGVPEPEEWLLIAAAGLLLVYVVATRRSH